MTNPDLRHRCRFCVVKTGYEVPSQSSQLIRTFWLELPGCRSWAGLTLDPPGENLSGLLCEGANELSSTTRALMGRPLPGACSIVGRVYRLEQSARPGGQLLLTFSIHLSTLFDLTMRGWISRIQADRGSFR